MHTTRRGEKAVTGGSPKVSWPRGGRPAGPLLERPGDTLGRSSTLSLAPRRVVGLSLGGFITEEIRRGS